MLLKDYCPFSELVASRPPIQGPKFPVIDSHSHWGSLLLGENYAARYDTADVVSRLKQKGIQAIVNLDGFDLGNLDHMLAKTEGFEDFIITYGNVDASRLDDADFASYVKKSIAYGVEHGIRGLKFWKPIGLGIKDSTGKYITPDDDRLRVVWETAAEHNIPVLFHIADPVAFFKPIDRFNERWEEVGVHPDWSFCDPKFYRFEQLMEMQQNLLRRNPSTTFIIAHFGSYSENLNAVAAWLDEFPNMNIDTAARIAELGRQPYSTRRFFERYQDRILFGTDLTPVDNFDYYEINWRFFETFDEYFEYDLAPQGTQGRFKIYGVGLEDEILKKLYSANFERLVLHR